ncbi:MAG TPA: ribosomal protein S18-alanine N-acetyltransferase [Pyrinomonadaceae bacterium]
MIKIGRAVASDALKIRELAVEAGIDAWTVRGYEAEIVRGDSFVLTALESERIVGFLVARLVPGADVAFDADLYNIAVQAGFRRQGIGRRLVSELSAMLRDKDVRNVWLEVRESNLSAIEFYGSEGFRSEITRKNFYSDPTENAVIMRLSLISR